MTGLHTAWQSDRASQMVGEFSRGRVCDPGAPDGFENMLTFDTSNEQRRECGLIPACFNV